MFWYAIGNGGYRRKIEAAIMRSTGVRAGTPDMGFVYQGQAYFIEIKSPGGRPSAHQLDAIAQITAAGGQARVCVGVDETLQCLEGWKLLRGKAS